MAKIERERVAQYLQTALRVVYDNGGQLPSREVMSETEKKIELTAYEKDRYAKTGYIRWESILHFYSIDCVKAGWLRKKKGIWYITDEGIQSLKLSPLEFINTAIQKYKEWKSAQGEEIGEPSEEPDGQITRKTTFEQSLSIARSEIEDYIKMLDPYAFQDLVAALLRGMGYYTPFIAPRGKDGGFDILAYKEPFGSVPPRIKVQVKHREQKVTAKEVRELSSLLHKEGETGLIVSSGGFTSDGEVEIRRSSRHIEKLDLEDLIGLWEEYYEKMQEEDRSLLPLRKVYFIAPTE